MPDRRGVFFVEKSVTNEVEHRESFTRTPPMGRRGPEKIGPASSSSEPTGESSGIETLSSPVESREAPSLENASTGAAATLPGASSCRKAAETTEGRLAEEGDRPTGVREAMASRLG